MRAHLTIRGLPPDIARQLDTERREREQSLNQLVIDLLRQALGLATSSPYDNGLGHHAGTWSEGELREFEEHTRAFEQIDPELWG